MESLNTTEHQFEKVKIKDKFYYVRLFTGDKDDLTLARSFFESLPKNVILARYRHINLKRLNEVLASAEAVVFVFESEKADLSLLGLGELHRCEGYFEIASLVHPSSQGLGIGTFLARNLINEAKKRKSGDITSCKFFMDETNRAAIASMKKIIEEFGGERVDKVGSIDVEFVIPI
jgi:ribosomal protein S18 acetylase RimI-like enzyme